MGIKCHHSSKIPHNTEFTAFLALQFKASDTAIIPRFRCKTFTLYWQPLTSFILVNRKSDEYFSAKSRKVIGFEVWGGKRVSFGDEAYGP